MRNGEQADTTAEIDFFSLLILAGRMLIKLEKELEYVPIS